MDADDNSMSLSKEPSRWVGQRRVQPVGSGMFFGREAGLSRRCRRREDPRIRRSGQISGSIFRSGCIVDSGEECKAGLKPTQLSQKGNPEDRQVGEGVKGFPES